MEADHWHQRWQEGRIGFHTGQPNRWLQQFYSSLGLQPEDSIFLPLCGKAVDLVWLAEQGHLTIGVELSPIAIEDFFREQGLAATRSGDGPFIRHQSGKISLLEGDFFDLTTQQLGEIKLLFDRAALVALPAEMRQCYVQHLATLLRPNTTILLVTTDYPQAEKQPPPFAVSDEEVYTLYGNDFEVEQLHSEDLSSGQDPLTERGVSSLTENIYRITRK